MKTKTEKELIELRSEIERYRNQYYSLQVWLLEMHKETWQEYEKEIKNEGNTVK